RSTASPSQRIFASFWRNSKSGTSSKKSRQASTKCREQKSYAALDRIRNPFVPQGRVGTARRGRGPPAAAAGSFDSAIGPGGGATYRCNRDQVEVQGLLPVLVARNRSRGVYSLRSCGGLRFEYRRACGNALDIRRPALGGAVFRTARFPGSRKRKKR